MIRSNTHRTALAALVLASLPARASAQAAPTVPLFDNLGTLHRSITTASPLAQRYFDQGLRLTYGFNHEEAVNAFREAARRDPGCAMCYWGIALALGPNINVPMDASSVAPANEAVRAAVARSSSGTEVERALIQALASRYTDHPPADRSPLDSAYANAMRGVARRFPRDPDVQALFAEALMDLSPWNFWTGDGTPRPGTEEIVATLERVIRTDSTHPGACHYYIHTVEASRDPGRAVPCAERLPRLMPGAGHIVHMPAHVYMRVGRYAEAVERNQHAASVDHAYLEGRHLAIYPLYYAHNLHFLWAAATMEGRSADAIRAARDLAPVVPPELLRQVPFFEHLAAAPYLALASFEHWDELLREPAPPPDLRVAYALWQYSRGLALAATSRTAEAEQARDTVAAIARALPADRVIGQNAARDILGIAAHHLGGQIEAARGQLDRALPDFREAIRVEDGLRYDEPPNWFPPIRPTLARVLLGAGRAADAERVSREDLQRNPSNGWSLYTLARSLRAQGRTADADRVDADWKRVWARADVKLAIEGTN